MEINSLFPTPVAVFDYSDKLTEEQLSFIYNVEKFPNQGNTTSVCRHVLDLESFSGLKKFVLLSLQEYLQNIVSVKNGASLRVTQSWLNYAEKNQYHHKHCHPNSVLSGVFYVNADQDLDKIFFYRETYQQIKFPIAEWNGFNSESWWLPVKTGQMIIFPSHLAHSVAPVETNETRISLSFNTFPIGVLGDEESLTELRL